MKPPLFSKAIEKLRKLAGWDEGVQPIVEAPTTLDLPWTPGGENTIQDMLDRIGFPWRSSCHDLIERFGLVRHPAYDWEQSPITPCPLNLDGLLYPISPQIPEMASRDHVPLWFSGAVWIKDDPIANIRHAHGRIAELLGPAPIGIRNNTISSIWRAGPARISLTVWPQELQTLQLDNPAQDKDRRLKTACSISIEPGYRRPMTAQEREWLSSFTPLGDVRGVVPISTLDALWANAPKGWNQDFLRLPPLDQHNFLGRIGLSSDGMALIVCASQLRIVPMARIIAFNLQKILPAKGGGGAYLSLVFHPSPGTEWELSISESFGDMQALDDLASHLSRVLNRPLRVPAPQYDC